MRADTCLKIISSLTHLVRINPSDYSHRTEIDPPMPLQYECVCLHISLQSLEILGDPKVPQSAQERHTHAANQPPPFREMARIRSSRPLDHAILFEVGGVPFVTVVKKPDEVVVKDLTSRVISTLKCEAFEPITHLVSSNCIKETPIHLLRDAAPHDLWS